MLFNSWIFLLFLLVTFALFYGVSRWSRAGTLQIGILIGASFVFYAFETPALLLLLLLSTLVNAMAAALLLRRETGRGAVLFLAVVFNLGTLAVFKYLGLFVGTFVAEAAEGHSSWWMEIPLPVGISFYTFQGLSLVIDLYRDRSDERFAAIRQLLVRGDYLSYYSRIAFFISFFPQLVAGPIVKASTFLPQIEFKRPGGIQWDLVVKNLILGFFLKMVVADNLKEVTVLMHYPNFQRLPQGDLFLLVFGYSFQIFADFAGYSLIAIGLGRLFGYRFPVNFNFPYISTS
ncbi:MAG: MBOAT family protein, partial [Verrucomicrobiota bacterium]